MLTERALAVVVTAVLSSVACKSRQEPKAEPAQPAAEQPDPDVLRVEVDVVAGVDAKTVTAALRVAERAFEAAGVTLDVAIDDSARAPKAASDWPQQMRRTRNPKLTEHVHLIIASTSDSGAHGETVYSESSRAQPDQAGAVVYAATVAAQYRAHPELAPAGVELRHLVGRTVAHELGHLIGCAHRTADDDTTIMVQNSTIGPIEPANIERWKLAALGPDRHGPRFSPESIIEFSLDDKLSVERAVPSYPDVD